MGGKQKAPPAPDYEGAARETAAGNLEAARFATIANRPNVTTPLGTQTWRRNGDEWEQIIRLTPAAQRTLELNQQTGRQFAQLAQTGLNRTRGLFANPALDTRGLAERPMGVGDEQIDRAISGIVGRDQPFMDRRRAALETQLANQGITRGSEAYRGAQDDLARAENDFRLGAERQGFAEASQQAQLANMLRQSGLQELAYLKDRPLALINALRTGAQVQMPQFQAYGQQATTSGPDLFGAAQSQFDTGLQRTNVANANDAALWNGIINAVGSIAGAAAASDRRVKRNIVRIGEHPTLPLAVYQWDWVSGGKGRGVMADEVEQLIPEAVTWINGVQHVYYGMLK